MGKVRLREMARRGENGHGPAESLRLKPIPVVGVLVRKADLLEALRVYVPALRDLLSTEDGEHFLMLLTEGGHHGDSAAE